MAQMPHLLSRKPQLGFTVIELLIVVVIVGILGSIAYPAFQDSIRKGRRADASAGWSAVQQAQERWRANKPAYASNAQLTPSASASAPGLGIPALTASGYYGIAIDDVSGAGYSVTATAVAGKSQASDGDCAQLRVRVVGGNVSYGSAPAGGTDFNWSSGNRCWIR